MLVVIVVLVSISCTPDHGRFVATIQPVLYVCDMINIYWNGHLSKQYSIMIYTVKTILI